MLADAHISSLGDLWYHIYPAIPRGRLIRLSIYHYLDPMVAFVASGIRYIGAVAGKRARTREEFFRQVDSSTFLSKFHVRKRKNWYPVIRLSRVSEEETSLLHIRL